MDLLQRFFYFVLAPFFIANTFQDSNRSEQHVIIQLRAISLLFSNVLIISFSLFKLSFLICLPNYLYLLIQKQPLEYDFQEVQSASHLFLFLGLFFELVRDLHYHVNFHQILKIIFLKKNLHLLIFVEDAFTEFKLLFVAFYFLLFFVFPYSYIFYKLFDLFSSYLLIQSSKFYLFSGVYYTLLLSLFDKSFDD